MTCIMKNEWEIIVYDMIVYQIIALHFVAMIFREVVNDFIFQITD